MDEPGTFTADNVHRNKVAVLRDVEAIPVERVATDTVRGQYVGYRNEVGLPASTTETYAAVRLAIDNSTWAGVPILLRTGKALAEKTIEIAVVFHDNPDTATQNILTFQIQPREGITLELLAKTPGFTEGVEPVRMHFDYRSAFNGDPGHPDAYERVLVEAFAGDMTNFTLSEEILISWGIFDAVLEAWANDDHGLMTYEAGTMGPASADELAAAAGTTWQGGPVDGGVAR
jgi:glucose-6-phosphate 1-dehydrogenase